MRGEDTPDLLISGLMESFEANFPDDRTALCRECGVDPEFQSVMRDLLLLVRHIVDFDAVGPAKLDPMGLLFGLLEREYLLDHDIWIYVAKKK